MYRSIRIALIAIAVAAPLSLLGQAGTQAPRGGAPLPSVTLPPELDRVLRDYERAWRANDTAALVALFTSDGFVMQPGRPAARGHAALASVYAGQGGGDLRLRAFAFAASDTVGVILGGYRYGDAAGDIGKFTLTLKRARGGRWLILSDMDNGNEAARR